MRRRTVGILSIALVSVVGLGFAVEDVIKSVEGKYLSPVEASSVVGAAPEFCWRASRQAHCDFFNTTNRCPGTCNGLGQCQPNAGANQCRQCPNVVDPALIIGRCIPGTMVCTPGVVSEVSCGAGSIMSCQFVATPQCPMGGVGACNANCTTPLIGAYDCGIVLDEGC